MSTGSNKNRVFPEWVTDLSASQDKVDQIQEMTSAQPSEASGTHELMRISKLLERLDPQKDKKYSKRRKSPAQELVQQTMAASKTLGIATPETQKRAVVAHRLFATVETPAIAGNEATEALQGRARPQDPPAQVFPNVITASAATAQVVVGASESTKMAANIRMDTFSGEQGDESVLTWISLMKSWFLIHEDQVATEKTKVHIAAFHLRGAARRRYDYEQNLADQDPSDLAKHIDTPDALYRLLRKNISYQEVSITRR